MTRPNVLRVLFLSVVLVAFGLPTEPLYAGVHGGGGGGFHGGGGGFHGGGGGFHGGGYGGSHAMGYGGGHVGGSGGWSGGSGWHGGSVGPNAGGGYGHGGYGYGHGGYGYGHGGYGYGRYGYYGGYGCCGWNWGFGISFNFGWPGYYGYGYPAYYPYYVPYAVPYPVPYPNYYYAPVGGQGDYSTAPAYEQTGGDPQNYSGAPPYGQPGGSYQNNNVPAQPGATTPRPAPQSNGVKLFQATQRPPGSPVSAQNRGANASTSSGQALGHTQEASAVPQPPRNLNSSTMRNAAYYRTDTSQRPDPSEVKAALRQVQGTPWVGHPDTSAPSQREVATMRPAVQNVIRALNAMPPAARQREIDSGRYDTLSAQELAFVRQAVGVR